jgi:hypothetical protein
MMMPMCKAVRLLVKQIDEDLHDDDDDDDEIDNGTATQQSTVLGEILLQYNNHATTPDPLLLAAGLQCHVQYDSQGPTGRPPRSILSFHRQFPPVGRPYLSGVSSATATATTRHASAAAPGNKAFCNYWRAVLLCDSNSDQSSSSSSSSSTTSMI